MKLIQNYKEKNKIAIKIKKPWIWIGGYKENQLIDTTKEIEEYCVEGNRISNELLKTINSEITEWIYCCSKTLEIVNFPSEGFIINDSIIKEIKKKD